MGEEETKTSGTKSVGYKIPHIYLRLVDDEDSWYAIDPSSLSTSRWPLRKSLDPVSIPPVPKPIEYPEFAAGGLDSSQHPQETVQFPRTVSFPSNKLFCLDTRHPEEGWKEASPMNTKRACHYMLADAGKIYVLGGLNLRRPPDADGKRLYAEFYDPNSDVWEELARLGDDDLNILPQPIYGHAIVDHGELGRKILFHEYFSGSLFYLHTGLKNVVGVYDDMFGPHKPPSAFVDETLYFLSYDRIFAYDVSSGRNIDKPVVLHDICTNCLPYRRLGESMPSAHLLSLGNKYLALIWAKSPEFTVFCDVHCSVLEMSKLDDTYEGKVLSCSTYSVQAGELEGCIAVSTPEEDVGLDREFGQSIESLNKQLQLEKDQRKRKRDELVETASP